MLIKTTDIITISGKRESGKTYLSKFLIDSLNANDYDIDIYDINREYDKEYGNIIRFKSVADYKEKIPILVNEAMNKGSKFLVIDDADLIIDQNSIPSAILECLQIGRHRDIGMILIFRRVNTMHKQVIFNTNHFFIFKSKLLLDRDYFKKNLSSDFDILNLEQYEFFYMNSLSDVAFKARINGEVMIKTGDK